MNKDRAGTSNSLQYLIWFNSKAVKIYSIVQSVKLLLALSIYLPANEMPFKWCFTGRTIVICFLCDKSFTIVTRVHQEAQWLSGRVFDFRPSGRGFEPHRRHCVVVLEQDTFILI